MASLADPDQPQQITAGAGVGCTEENLAWSPDSEQACLYLRLRRGVSRRGSAEPLPRPSFRP